MKLTSKIVTGIIDHKFNGTIILQNGSKLSTKDLNMDLIGYNYDNPNYDGVDLEKKKCFYYGPSYDSLDQKELYNGSRIVEFIPDTTEKIYTSYFANLKNLPDNLCPISICGKAPDWYTGIQFKKLAPKYWFFLKYKEDGNEEFYTTAFDDEILKNLKADEVVSTLKELAGNKIPCLICYEKPGDFCHRHLVAEWIQDNLAIEVEEYKNN